MTLDRETLRNRAAKLIGTLTEARIVVATAESCTGGLIAAYLTDVPGSSSVLDRGFVTYSNAAKSQMLGVPGDLIARVGAVSEEVARAMAKGALGKSLADVAVAVTGIAGPGGGSADKPVGLVHLAVATSGEVRHEVKRFGSLDRDEIRLRTVAAAFDLIETLAQAGSAETP